MVNHFSSLLANFNLIDLKLTRDNFLLGIDDTSYLLGDPFNDTEGYFIGIEGDKIYNKLIRNYNNFINNKFIKINLPTELENFHELLFPKTNNAHKNQFLLYTYLSLVNSTDLKKFTTYFDNRITYDLTEWDNYFKFFYVTYKKDDLNGFNLLFSGKFDAVEFENQGPLVFNISQQNNLNKILVYCPIIKKYLKSGKSSDANYFDMDIDVVFSNNTNSSKAIEVGNTGLFFRFIGQPEAFTTSSNKLWSFSLESPYIFDFLNFFDNLLKNYNIIDNMLRFKSTECNISYENLWRTHYNSVYKVAGLLLAYVERVNILWESKE
jgi:hypothetical protein